MIAVLLLAVVLGPVIEIVVAVYVASLIGWLNTLGLVVLFSILGLVLLKVEGVAALGEIRRDLYEGKSPTRGLVDGGLRLIGALLLILPGLLSGVLGILLLIPPIRAALVPVVTRRLADSAAARVSRSRVGRVIVATGGRFSGGSAPMNDRSRNGDYIDVEGWDVGQGDTAEPGQLPRAGEIPGATPDQNWSDQT